MPAGLTQGGGAQPCKPEAVLDLGESVESGVWAAAQQAAGFRTLH